VMAGDVWVKGELLGHLGGGHALAFARE
jgi:hypothetical protein